MGWGKAWKKIKKVANRVARIGLAGVTAGMSEIGGSHSIGSQAEKTLGKIDSAVAGLDPVERKKAERAQEIAIAAQETAAKNAADADYYNQIMKSRRQQIADNAGSQTNFTTEEGAFGSFDSANLGGFDPITGAFGRKKKVVR